MASMLDTIRQERIEKVLRLRETGQNPYPSKVNRTHKNTEIIEKYETLQNTEVTVVGRVMSWRDIGKLIFAKIEDLSGGLQLFIRVENLPENIDTKLFDMGDFVEATGIVMKTKTGEISVEVKSIRIIAKSIRPLPEKWAGLKDEDTIFRKRYLDFMINKDSKSKIITRTKIVRWLREFLWEREFIEIENPSLEIGASGAEAKPFLTHINVYDMDLSLRICAGELWQKRSMVGGFEKTFEIARVYRNEGADAEHNPEFTMLEFYWAYSDFDKMLSLHEDLFSGVVKAVTGDYKIQYHGKTLDFTPPYKRARYNDLLIEYAGIDLDKYENLEDLRKTAIEKGVELEPNLGWSTLIDQIFKQKVRPKIFEPVFVIDYPFALTPLAKPVEDNPKYIQMSQLIIDSMEMCRIYGELNDPLDQMERFKIQKKSKEGGDENAYEADFDYVEAMEYGMPPMTGSGIGIDRLVKVLTDAQSLREIIAYPIMKPE